MRQEYPTLEAALTGLEAVRSRFCPARLAYRPSIHRGLPLYVVLVDDADAVNAGLMTMEEAGWRRAA